MKLFKEILEILPKKFTIPDFFQLTISVSGFLKGTASETIQKSWLIQAKSKRKSSSRMLIFFV